MSKSVSNPINASFHKGETAVQARFGVQERLAELGPRVIRDYMPEQHREFFTQLPLVIVGSVGAHGQPWASVLTNPAGFIQSANPYCLNIFAHPQQFDPLYENLVDGAQLGLLGIEPHTRRRNRMNGVVSDIHNEGFTVHVTQSFGNCPKYIQARKAEYLIDNSVLEMAVIESHKLDESARRLIMEADTFFIATAYPFEAREEERVHGIDVSHRGGKPGFVRVDDDVTLTVPDFSGNLFFNTIGNIAVNPYAGLLFIDYSSGDLLYLAVKAEIIWQGAEVEAFIGAQQLLRLHIISMRRVEARLPIRWSEAVQSPVLEHTGSW
jgi:predicted pyridoxine 5'-phosphate oxidase superfamily flavin-nucleotide-binding protein